MTSVEEIFADLQSSGRLDPSSHTVDSDDDGYQTKYKYYSLTKKFYNSPEDWAADTERTNG
jgi:hypothetical protein